MASGFLSHLQPPPSYRTWVGVFHKSWAGVLKFHCENQHSKCTICEKMKAFRRQASTNHDQDLVTQAYLAHLQRMVEDRKADARWRQIGFDSVVSNITMLHEGCTTWLTMTLDGMDCAKFKVPLNVNKSKEFTVG